MARPALQRRRTLAHRINAGVPAPVSLGQTAHVHLERIGRVHQRHVHPERTVHDRPSRIGRVFIGRPIGVGLVPRATHGVRVAR